MEAKIKSFCLKDWKIIDKMISSLPACIFMGALYYRHHYDINFPATRQYLQKIADLISKDSIRGVTLNYIENNLDSILQKRFDVRKSKAENKNTAILDYKKNYRKEFSPNRLFCLDCVSLKQYTDLLLHLLIEPKMIVILVFDPRKIEGRGKSYSHAAILESIDIKAKKISVIDPARFDTQNTEQILSLYSYDLTQFDTGWKSTNRLVIRMFICAEKKEMLKKLREIEKIDLGNHVLPLYSKKKAPKVFIAHSSKDKERFVLPFAKQLRQNGVNAWVDKWEILPGDELPQKNFEVGIKDCTASVFVISEYSLASDWFWEELNTLVNRRIDERIRLIPIILDNIPKSKVPQSLRSKRYIRIKDLSDLREGLKETVKAIFEVYNKPPINLRVR